MTNKVKKEEIHIEQMVTGHISFGNAGINKKNVDLALQKEHLRQIRDESDAMLKTLERDKEE